MTAILAWSLNLAVLCRQSVLFHDRLPDDWFTVTADYLMAFTTQMLVTQLSYISNFKFSTVVAALPNNWFYRVSAETGWPVVSIL